MPYTDRRPATPEPGAAKLMTPATIAAAASARGHHRRGFFTSQQYDLDLLYSPDADLDGTFGATDVETGELLLVRGWLFCLRDDG